MIIEQLISLTYLASGLILLMLAITIFRENLKNRLNRVVSIMLFLAGLAPLTTAIYNSVLEGAGGMPSWVINSFYAWELFFPALLYFSAIFPEPQPIYKNHKRLLQLAFIPHLLHLLMVILLADPDKVLGALNFRSQIPIWGQILSVVSNFLKILTAFFGFLMLFHTRFFSLINLVYVGLALYLLSLSFAKIENIRLKQQVRVVLLGLSIALGLYAIGFIIPSIFLWRLSANIRDTLLMASLVIGPGSIAWAIVRYQFLDIGLIARRSLIYSITTLIVVGGYLLIVVQIGDVVRRAIGQESEIINILVVIVLLMFFQPIYTQVDDFVRRIFVKFRGDYSQLVESFSRQILTIFQADKLVATVADVLEREMFIERVEFVFPEKDGSMRLVAKNRPELRIQIEEPVSSFLKAKQSPVFAEELASRVHKGYLGEEIISRGVILTVPLVRQAELVGILLLYPKVAGFRYNSEDITFLNIMANQIVVAMENAELYAETLEKQRLEEELAVAKQIQIGLLPRAMPTIPNHRFAAFIEPSRQVGGDFYDFVHLPDNCLGIVIADASGKGVPAALLIARMQAVLQSEARSGKPICEVMGAVNRMICDSTPQERFATCFYAVLYGNTGKLIYCNAGHNYPLIIKRDGRIEELIEGGLLLGVFPQASYQSGEKIIEPGDILFMYTDGLNEARDIQDQEYGEMRIKENVSNMRNHPAEMICSHLVKNVKQFSAGSDDMDDMTIVIVKALEY